MLRNLVLVYLYYELQNQLSRKFKKSKTATGDEEEKTDKDVETLGGKWLDPDLW